MTRCAAALLLCATTCVIACRTETSNRTTATSSASASASASAKPKTSRLVGLTAKLDDQELLLSSAIAFSRGGAALHITLSTHPLECAKIAGGGFRLERGEFLVDFTVAPVRSPGEDSKWMVTRSRLGDVTRQGAMGTVEVPAFDPRETVRVGFDDVTLVFPPAKLVLDGKLTATGCGIVPLTERAQVRPQKQLKVELNGKVLVMNGASIAEEKGETVLRLSTEPHACDKGLLGSDVVVRLALAGEPLRVASVRVDGFSIPRPLSAKTGGSLTVEMAPSDAAGEHTAELAGQLDLAGNTLVLGGTAQVQDCSN